MKILLVFVGIFSLLFLVTVMSPSSPVPGNKNAPEDSRRAQELSVKEEDGLPPATQTNVVLDLSNQSLRSLPGDFFRARTDITELNLSYNMLSGALPAEVRFLTALRVLDLSHNQFTGVPAEVGQLTELIVLNLSYNPITGLPYEIGNLKNLKTLDLRGTEYSTADLAHIRSSIPKAIILTDE